MWHVRLSLRAVDEDQLFAALDAVDHLSPSATFGPDDDTGSIAVFVDASSAHAASDAACSILAEALPDAVITGIEVRQEGEFFADLERPIFPAVVGYAEIAEIAGVSRQRVRQLADSDGFPSPVIETAQGPLFPQVAAERWASSRQPRSGRPRKQPAVS